MASHTDYVGLEDEVERWLAYNNGLVDRVANQANLARPSAFWTLWNQLRKEWTLCYMEAKTVVETHVAVAKAVRTRKQHGPTVVIAAPVVPQLHVLACSEDCLRQVFQKFGRPFVMTLLPWLRLLDSMAQQTEPRWISFAQLYIAFCKDTSVKPPYFRPLHGIGTRLETTQYACCERSTLASASRGFSSKSRPVLNRLVEPLSPNNSARGQSFCRFS